VVFLGGSITENADQGGFITGFSHWVKAQNPNVHLKIVNSGLSATGSDFGALRVERDVIVHKPDLVFVEFAVNDGERDSRADMESIVRRIRGSRRDVDIVFLYTLTDQTWEKLRQGKPIAAVENHEAVARHYGIPSVSLGASVISRLAKQEWKWGDFSSDACHPTAAGYAAYREDFVEALDRIYKSSFGRHDQLPKWKFGQPMKTKDFQERQDKIFKNGPDPTLLSSLPIPGKSWVQLPVYESGGNGRWSILSFPMDGSIVTSQAAWKPQRWFPEVGGFTGSSSRVLFEQHPEKGICLRALPSRIFSESGASRNVLEGSALLWKAEIDGTFLIEVGADRLEGHANNDEASAGLDVILFRNEQPDGERVVELRVGPSKHGVISYRDTLLFRKGDCLGVLLAGEGYEFFGLEGFWMNISKMPEAEMSLGR
jgi:lysophospholipase L1-like esterase